ncbi:MAG: HNH endonuclease, partial [Muribaculaceae bacterium]|nr:HNH endonuclease [Muribaculaceae bacterium]
KIYNDKLYIRTHTYDNIKNFSLVTISFEEGKFVHQGQTFFEEQGAQMEFYKRIGDEWTGAKGIDDYC